MCVRLTYKLCSEAQSCLAGALLQYSADVDSRVLTPLTDIVNVRDNSYQRGFSILISIGVSVLFVIDSVNCHAVFKPSTFLWLIGRLVVGWVLTSVWCRLPVMLIQHVHIYCYKTVWYTLLGCDTGFTVLRSTWYDVLNLTLIALEYAVMLIGATQPSQPIRMFDSLDETLRINKQ